VSALGFPHDVAVERLCRQIDEFLTEATAMTDLELLAPARCLGWSRLEVVVHVRMGLEELAITTTKRMAADADHDAASYWRTHSDDRDEDPVPHILWLRRVASAHSRPSGAIPHLRVVADAAKSAVKAMAPGVVDFQGKRMRSGDFLATWVVELAVHQLDLDRGSEGTDSGRGPSGLDWARQTLEALAEKPLPAALDDRSAVLLGLGRIASDAYGDGDGSIALPSPYPISL
jgi:hypothetical protein